MVMNNKSIRGAAALIVLGVLVLLGGGGYFAVKKGIFNGDTHRANESAKTTEELLASTKAQGAAAAAYVGVQGDVIGTLPDSKEKDFLNRSNGIILSYLPAQDPKKVIEAQNLKIAVLTGQVELANSMTRNALQRADEADQRTARAISSKRSSDRDLQEAAAETRGANAQAFLFTCIAIAIGALYLYTKVTHVSPGSLSKIVTDIRSGSGETDPAIVAIDTYTNGLQQMMTKGNYKLGQFIKKVVS